VQQLQNLDKDSKKLGKYGKLNGEHRVAI